MDTTDSPTVPAHIPSSFIRNSATRRSRLANEYSEPQVDTKDDETARSLIASSRILSMDDSSIRSSRGLSGTSLVPCLFFLFLVKTKIEFFRE